MYQFVQGEANASPFLYAYFNRYRPVYLPSIQFYNYYTLWSLPQFQISVIPACPESFRKDSRRASLAGMTPKNKHSNNGRPAVSAAGFFIQ